MPATWKSLGAIPEAVDHQDPIQHWLLVPSPYETEARAEAQRDLVVAYVFNFANEGALERFRARFDPGSDLDADAAVFFPGGIEAQPIFGEPTRMIVGFSRLGNVDAIFRFFRERNVGQVFLTGIEVENVTGIEAPQQESPDGNDRFVAVIDTDIAFANERFRKSTTHTRFAAFWDQNGAATAASALFLGQALQRGGIDQLLAQFDDHGNVDEPALYNRYFADTYPPDAFPRLPASLGHGTHVLDLITGGLPNGPSILGINLRNRAVDATHGRLLFPWLMLALLWILKFTGINPASPRAQINFSFGGIAGRHDGEGPIEMVFDALIANDLASAITLPAGNFCDSQTHASRTGSELHDPQELSWIVQPDDGSSNIVEIWLPPGGANASLIDVTLAPPGGPAHVFSDIDFGIWELSDGAEVYARVYVQRVGTFGATERTRITIVGRHTAIDRDHFQYLGGVPELAGIWTIGLTRTGLGDAERVDLWIERDDQLGMARNGAKQSYFETDRAVWPERAPPGLAVTNENTLSDIATGADTLVVAGAFRNARQVPEYSSEGVAEPELRTSTAAAICDDSPVHRGVLAAGFYSGSTRAMNGTSAASAVAGRLVSTRIAAGDGVRRGDMQALAQADNGGPPPDTAPIDPLFGTYADPPKTRIGSGILQTAWTRLPRFVP